MPKPKTTRILIAGAPSGCWTNIGDQAVLIGMLDDLSSAFPRVDVTVVSSNPAGYLERFGVREIAHTDIQGMTKLAHQSDLMILGGGSLFYDYWAFEPSAILTPTHEGLAFVSGFAVLAALTKTPLMIYAVGVGPLNTGIGKDLTRMTFELASAITVRDTESRQELVRLGIPEARVKVCADPAFSLAQPDFDPIRATMRQLVGRELPQPILGVALRNWDISADPALWEPEVARALDEFLSLEGGSVVFTPFHKLVDWPLTDDKGVAESVLARMHSTSNAVILSSEPDAQELLTLFSQFDLVLAMRLHALIFAMKSGVPAVALSYDPKVSSFMKTMRADDYQVLLKDANAEAIASRLRNAYRRVDELSTSYFERSRESTRLARKNATIAAKFGHIQRHRMSEESQRLMKSLGFDQALRNHESMAGSDEPGNLLAEAVPAGQEYRASTLAVNGDSADLQKTSPRRIAILTNRLLDWETMQPRFGGGERYCFQLGTLLRKLGFEVVLYQIAAQPFEGEFLGFKVIGLRRGDSYSEFEYGVCDAFYEVSLGYDHVIYLVPNLASGRIREDALLICHGIWFDHNLYESFFSFRSPEWFEHVRRAFSNPARVVSVDLNSINVVRALWPDLAERMTHLPNWVDTRAFNPPTEGRNGHLTVLFPRRSDRLRGSHMLSEILEQIPHQCQFQWVGTSNPEDDLSVELIARQDTRLSFQDAPFEQMPGFYRGAEICVIPTVASEGTSLACLEAMASGCAVVATLVGGLPELIQSGVNGLLTAPDAKDIALAINHLIEQPRERLRLQRAAVKTAFWFSLEVWEKRWVDVLVEQGWMESPTGPWLEQQRLFDTLNEQLLHKQVDDELITELIPKLPKLPNLEDKTESEVDGVNPFLRALKEDFEGQLLDREREIQTLEAQLIEYRRRVEDSERQRAIADQVRVAREEGISWLREELGLSRDIVRQLTDLSNSLGDEVHDGRKLVTELESLRKDQERSLQTLDETLQRLVLNQEKSNQAEAQKRLARLAELEKAVQYKVAQVQENDRIIRSRDEAIVWLKGEVENYQKLGQRLGSANRMLNEELAEKDALLQVFHETLQSLELELLGLKHSRGWLLLNQVRKIRRRVRSLTGRRDIDGEVSARPSILVDRHEVDWHSQLAPLLEEIRSQVMGLAAATGATRAITPDEINEDAWFKIRLLPQPDDSELRMFLDQDALAKQRRLPDVVCFSVIDWDFRYQRPQQIMSQFAARGHRVFYFSTTRFNPADSSPRVTVKPIKANVFEVELSSIRQPDVYGEVIGGINQKELVASLEELRSRFSIDEAISYVMIASWCDLALLTQERWGWRIIYDCMDEWDRFPGIKPAIVDAEKVLVEGCDLLVVSSQCLSAKWASRKDKLRLVRNAADYEFYSARFGPSHLLADATHPIVGYFGAIAEWFDVDLVAFLARSRPNYTFVLLGGIFSVDVSELMKLSNVRLLGQHPYELMPKYLYQFDVCMIPFKLSPITEATDPVKLYEYLSGGKPVVSVDLPELEPYRKQVYIAKDQDEFVALLDRALTDDDRKLAEERRALARANDWASRYQTVVTGLSERTSRVSVIIVTLDNLELTKLCLESVICNTEYPNYELIIVDNHSEDGTRAYLQFMAERFAHIQVVLNNANEGFARANNQAIELSTGDVFVLLNNDTVVPPGWLSRLVRHVRHKEVGMVGPVTNFVGNEARIEVEYQTWEEMEDFVREHTRNHDGEAADIKMLAMFCVAFRRDVYTEIGPLDEQFGIGMFEDDDYSHRVRLKGYRVICAADVFVHHVGQATFKKLIEAGKYDQLFARNLQTFESKWNVKWEPKSNFPLTFRTDYCQAELSCLTGDSPAKASISSVEPAGLENQQTRTST